MALKENIRAEEALRKAKEQKQPQKQRTGPTTILAHKFATRISKAAGSSSSSTSAAPGNPVKPSSLVKLTRPVDKVRNNKCM